MVIVECVALAIMISNHLVMPIVLQPTRAIAGATRLRQLRDLGGFVLGVRRVAILVVLLLGYAYYRAAGEAALAVDRPDLLRGHRPDRAGLRRRPVLAARHGARRDRRASSSASRSGSTRCCSRASSARAALVATIVIDGPSRRRGAEADGPASAPRCRSSPTASCGASRSTSSPMSPSRWRGPRRARAAAGERFVGEPDLVDRAEFPALPRQRHGRRTAGDGRALSRRGADATASFDGFAHSRGQLARRPPRSRHPPAALRRAPARLRHRRGLLAACAVAPAAPAQRRRRRRR